MLDTLDNLKDFLLPNTLQAKTGYDTDLQIIGAGVAARIDSYCNRQLARVSGNTYETNGDREIIVLPGYPLEEVTQVETQYRDGESWTVVSGAIASVDKPSGLVLLCGRLGDYLSRIRITYTGGYWFDNVGGQSQPAGSTALPGHIHLAWCLQCKHVWESLDKTGSSLSEKAYVSPLATLDLVPEVKEILSGERRQA